MLLVELPLDDGHLLRRLRVRTSRAAESDGLDGAELLEHLPEVRLGRFGRKVSDEHGAPVLLLLFDPLLQVFVLHLSEDEGLETGLHRSLKGI